MDFFIGIAFADLLHHEFLLSSSCLEPHGQIAVVGFLDFLQVNLFFGGNERPALGGSGGLLVDDDGFMVELVELFHTHQQEGNKDHRAAPGST